MDKTVEMSQKIEILQLQNCFKRLTTSEIETLATLLTEVHLAKGRTIVTEGDHVDSVYFIIKGKADVVHIRVNNGELVTEKVAVLGENENIGLSENGFYSLTGLRTATVITSTEMILLRLSVAAFHGFALAYSHVNEVMRTNAQVFAESESKSSLG